MKKPTNKKLSDAQAKEVLRAWPQTTRKLWQPVYGGGRWLRAQPTDGGSAGPTISSPGATLFATQPDGLFVYFGDLESCDLVAIEVCGTIQNLNDKRSRYQPATHSLVLSCSLEWLTTEIEVQGGGRPARWQAAGTISEAPFRHHAIPVRHLRVLYALPGDKYHDWCRNNVPAGHEYFCPHSSLNSYGSQKMQTFLRQLSAVAQFYIAPKGK